MKMATGNPNVRRIDAGGTVGGDSVDGGMIPEVQGTDYSATIRANNRKVKKLQRKVKQLQKKAQAKAKPAKKNTATKFNPKNPGAYLPAKAWGELEPHQHEAARAARAKAGIPQKKRGVGSIATVQTDTEEASDDDCVMEVVPEEEKKMPAFVSKIKQVNPLFKGDNATVLQAPRFVNFATTQREQLYAKKAGFAAGTPKSAAKAIVSKEAGK
jgi:hypothetical protein